MKLKIFFVILVSFCLIQTDFAQKPKKKIEITGVVLDANMKPVENVVIFVDKKKTNSTTDSKGIFHIKVKPTAKKMVVFSYFNGVREMEINGKTTINFTLDGNSSHSAQPVQKESGKINIGYGEIDKESLTMPVNKLESEKSRYGTYSNIFEILTGEVPGLEVTGTSIKIRNSTSFQLSTEPLFVVDGVIVPSINDISPSHVKSIEVLKGPSASIYGARGANGVIIITLISGNYKK